MRFAAIRSRAVTPAAARVRGDEPITASTAILMCVRNESPERVVRNLQPLLAGLARAGVADRFHVYVLSDTSDADDRRGSKQRASTRCRREWHGRIAGHLSPPRRQHRLQGRQHRRLLRALGRRARIRGDARRRQLHDRPTRSCAWCASCRPIRRSASCRAWWSALPSTSAFARLFQFGMRLGMRSYTLGSAWWQGDCGPYWGHNAILRLAPFIAHCRLPALPAERTARRPRSSATTRSRRC